MDEIKVSIFTPSYNREHTLRRCYESILKQDNLNNIEWILINDGSTDNTEVLVQEILNEKRLNIVYLSQENKGKQATWNRAVLNAKGQYFIGLDSDDALQPKSLFNILNANINFLEKENIIGLRCLALSNITQKPSGRKISDNSIEQSWFDEFSSSGNFGERIDILKTDLIKKILYPIASDIKFIPEIWFYVKTASAGYEFIYSPDALSLFFDDETENRLSKSSLFKHAQGHYISRSVMLKEIPTYVWLKNPMALIKTVIRFSQMANHLSKSFSERREATNTLFTLLSFLFTPFSKRNK
ncbi:glycosyl transferase family 2 [Pasteurellaceae bacterium RH1A]|nr:glycosyl transferase family 2 [Pasteurellaceae bacterium RH1A]